MPERHLPWLAWRGRDKHAVVGDFLNAPRRRPQRKGLAHLALEHHFLVEFTDTDGAISSGEEYAIESAVRNGAGVGDRYTFRPFPRRDRPVHPVPGDAWPELRELVRRIAARQHVEHAFEHAHAQIGEWRRASHACEQVIDVPAVDAHHRDDLLRE